MHRCINNGAEEALCCPVSTHPALGVSVDARKTVGITSKVEPDPEPGNQRTGGQTRDDADQDNQDCRPTHVFPTAASRASTFSCDTRHVPACCCLAWLIQQRLPLLLLLLLRSIGMETWHVSESLRDRGKAAERGERRADGQLAAAVVEPRRSTIPRRLGAYMCANKLWLMACPAQHT